MVIQGLIKAFITTSNFDIIFLLEMFLGSIVPQNDKDTMTNSYSLLRADHPSNSNHEDVCLSFKQLLPLTRRNNLSIVQKRLVTLIIVDNKQCFVTFRYMLPNQNHEKLKNLHYNLHLSSSSSSFFFFNNNHSTFKEKKKKSDFKEKSSKQCSSDKSNRAGIQLDNNS